LINYALDVLDFLCDLFIFCFIAEDALKLIVIGIEFFEVMKGHGAWLSFADLDIGRKDSILLLGAIQRRCFPGDGSS